MWPTGVYWAEVSIGTPPRSFPAGIDGGSGDLVVWMTGIPGIYASHVGMILESEKGPVVCHASRSAGQVTEELLVDYVQRTDWLPGMKFARLQSRAEIISRPLKLDFRPPSPLSGKKE